MTNWSKCTVIILSLVTLLSCGKSSDDEVTGAILSANISLSKGDCQAAIDTLSAVGMQQRNASYLKTLSSAYACRAGFSVITFFTDDITKTGTPSAGGGMAKYSTSLTTVTGALENDSKYADLQTAIDILLYAGGFSSTTQPTATERAKYFGSKDASEINSQLAFMLMAQLGKYLRFYADSGLTGVKGAGTTYTNTCLTTYANADTATSNAVNSFLSLGGNTGVCVSSNSGHPYLDTSIGNATRFKRMCQGVVLLNNVLEILPAILASAGGGDVSSTSVIISSMNTLKTTLTSIPAINTVVGSLPAELSQDNCETNTSTTNAGLESYFAIFFEGLIL